MDLAPLLTSNVVLVKLELRNAGGQLVSQNLYWLSAETSSYRALVRLPRANVSAMAVSSVPGIWFQSMCTWKITATAASLEEQDDPVERRDGARILPAYYGDNYVSLLPGEARDVEIEYPAAVAKGPVQLAVRGWILPANGFLSPRAE